jgi:hypothetical protein
MRIFKISSSSFILPSGSELYQGTIEDFDYNNPLPGGYDNVFWTTEYKKIARAYIPTSHGKSFISIKNIKSPSQDKTIQNIQKLIGIEYNVDKFKIENMRLTLMIRRLQNVVMMCICLLV